MKQNEIHDELLDAAKRLGIKIRKDSGTFRGGYCILNDERLIILNRYLPLETISSQIARGLSNFEINEIYLKPALREYIDKEAENYPQKEAFKLEIKE